jgi:MFS family permease
MTGSYVSMFGSRITTIACPLLALYLTNSPVAAGIVAFAATVPSVVVYLPAGALVDHWDPRRTLLMCESGRGVVIATITATLAVGKLNIPLLIPLVIAEEILEVFSTLADQRCVRSLVPSEQASSAQACIETRTHAVMLTGRPAGVFLFSLAPLLPFLTDALSFVISVITVIRFRGRQASTAPTIQVSWQRQLKPLADDISQGWKWLFRDRYARAAITLSAAPTIIAQALIMVFLAQAHTDRLSPGMVGLVLAAGGGGGVLGAIIASRWPPQPKKISLILIQMLIWAVAFALLAATDRQQFLLLAIVMAVLSLSGALGNIEVGAYLIRNVHENMLARVTSILRLMNISAYAVGPVLGGALIQWYGAQDALFALFLIMLFLTILTACSPSMWGREAFALGFQNTGDRRICRDQRVARAQVALRRGALADGIDPAVTVPDQVAHTGHGAAVLDGQHVADSDQPGEADRRTAATHLLSEIDVVRCGAAGHSSRRRGSRRLELNEPHR